MIALARLARHWNPTCSSHGCGGRNVVCASYGLGNSVYISPILCTNTTERTERWPLFDNPMTKRRKQLYIPIHLSSKSCDPRFLCIPLPSLASLFTHDVSAFRNVIDSDPAFPEISRPGSLRPVKISRRFAPRPTCVWLGCSTPVLDGDSFTIS